MKQSGSRIYIPPLIIAVCKSKWQAIIPRCPPIAVSLFLLLACLLYSCNKIVGVHCTPQGAGIFFVGFDSTDIHVVTYYRYPMNQNFLQPIDSSSDTLIYYDPKINYNNNHNAWYYGDTVISGGLSANFDWKIKAFPVGKEWRVSQIKWQDAVFSEKSSSIESHSCQLDSYKVESAMVHMNYFVLSK